MLPWNDTICTGIFHLRVDESMDILSCLTTAMHLQLDTIVFETPGVRNDAVREYQFDFVDDVPLNDFGNMIE
jgi:hypothetical protein